MSEDRAPTAEPVVKLGVRLKQVREKSGQSLRAVARQLGVSPSFLSQLENGKSQPSVATLYSLTQLLDVSIDELFAADHVEVAEESRAVAGISPASRLRWSIGPPVAAARSAARNSVRRLMPGPANRCLPGCR